MHQKLTVPSYYLGTARNDHNWSFIDAATIQRRTGTSESRPTALRLEANNPIYDGVTYETTPGESLKSLDCSVPTTPSVDSSSTSRYTFDMASPKLPPPRKSSISYKERSKNDNNKNSV